MRKKTQGVKPLPFLKEKEDGLELRIHVQPRASRNEVSGIHGSSLKIRVMAPPVDGKANKACQKFLAKFFKVSSSNVTMIAGESSREKKFFIRGAKPSMISRLYKL